LRLVGPYFSPNHTALYLERTWWLGLGLALTWHGRRRYWSVLALAVVGLALWLTASRGAWLLGMPVGALVFSWTAGLLQRDRDRPVSQWSRHTAVIGVSMAAILSLVIGAAFRDTLWLRLTNSATIVERLAIWQATLQLWQDHWLLGVGPGGFFWRYPSYLAWSLQAEPNLLHPHNLWLEVLAGWGALGLLWFLLMGWQVWRLGCTVKSRKQPAWQASGLLAALAAGIAHGQADTFGALSDLTLWNWLALGLLVNMIMAQSRQPNKD
jgi:O-antigen ligase